MNKTDQISFKTLSAYQQDGPVLDLVDHMVPVAGVLMGVTERGADHFTRLDQQITSPDIFDTGAVRIFRDYQISVPSPTQGPTVCEGTSIAFYPYAGSYAIVHGIPAYQLVAAVIDQSTLNDVLQTTSRGYKLSSHREHLRAGGGLENMVVDAVNTALVMHIIPPAIVRSNPEHLGQGQIYISQYGSNPYILRRDGSRRDLPALIAAKMPHHEQLVTEFNTANQAISAVVQSMRG
jgi:hypothetical protein